MFRPLTRLVAPITGLALLVSSLAVLVPLAVSPVRAATITVTTLTDVTSSSDGETTLREAVTAATTSDVVDFSPSLFTSGQQTIELVEPLPACCKGLFEVRGPGRDLLTIKGPRSDRTMTGYEVSGGVLTVTMSTAPAFSASVGGLQGRVIVHSSTAPITGEHVVTGVSGNTFTATTSLGDTAFTAVAGTVTASLVSSSTHWGLAGRFMNVTSSVKITNLTIEGFMAERGGAFQVTNNATLYLDNVRLRKNAAFDWYSCGGAITTDRSSLDIRNSIIVESLGKCAGAINAAGATLYMADTTIAGTISNNGVAFTSYMPTEIVNTTISGSVNYAGTAVSAFVMASFAMPLTITGSNFSGAGAANIGNSSSTNISNSTFSTSSGTAALRLGHTLATLTNNTIESCTTEDATGIKSTTGNTFTNSSVCDTVSAPNGGKVTTYSRTSNVVTMNTASAHGFDPGDTIRLCGLQAFSTSCSYTMVATTVPTSTSFTFTQVASDIASTVAMSDTTRAVWVFEQTAVGPGAPTITATTAGDQQVLLAWSAGTSGTSSIIDYAIQYSQNSGAWTTYVDGVSTSTNRVVTGLTNGDSYRFRVAAQNSSTTSAYSAASGSVVPSLVSSVTTTTPSSTSSPTIPNSTSVAPSSTNTPTSVPSSGNTAGGANADDTSDTQNGDAGPLTSTTTATRASSASTTTTIPAPDAPKAEPGAAAATIDGRIVNGVITRTGNVLVVEMGDISVKISGVNKDGSTVELDEDGNLRLSQGDLVSIEAGGFSPGTGVELWVFSTPFRLAEVIAGSDGRIGGTYPLPADVDPGEHRVVLKGQDAKGSNIVAGVGLFIGQPFKGDGVSPWLIWTPLTLAIAVGLIIPASRRRRKQQIAVG